MDDKINVLMYENGSGFSFYTSHLCRSIAQSFNASITYITTSNNYYFKDITNVNVVPILKNYSRHRKYSILWIINRMMVSLFNCRIRNKYCKKNKYDVVSIQFTTPIIDQFYLKKMHKLCKRIVLTAHDVIPPIKSFYWSKKSLKKIYNEVDCIIVHSNGNKDTLVKEFEINPSKIEVINHGIDIEYISLNQELCRRRIGLSKDKIIVLFYGLIREQKGLDTLIQSLKNIQNIELYVAGAMPNGESFEHYNQMINDNNIDVVKNIGFVPDDMTDAVFNSCDFVCLPYKYFYSQSGVFMQAIKYRKPVIVSDVSSFREFIEKYNIGLICKPNDSNDLHYKLLKMIKILKYNPNFFNDELEKAAFENSWDVSAKKHMEVFGRDLKK